MRENSQKLKGLRLFHEERLKIYARMKAFVSSGTQLLLSAVGFFFTRFF